MIQRFKKESFMKTPSPPHKKTRTKKTSPNPPQKTAPKGPAFPPSYLFLNILRLTQAAAAACLPYIGSGSASASDRAAVAAMRKAFKTLPIKGTVVIGEGERDHAPMLYIGEKVGRSLPTDPQWSIAVDPLEGTNLCASARGGALSVVALAPAGKLCQAPDVYMNKIACGPQAKGAIDLTKTPEQNIRSAAKALNKKPQNIIVSVLNRPRHKALIQAVRKTSAKVYLIEDGDLSAAIQTCLPGSHVDLIMGSGGSPEGVLTAAALKCMGGDFQGRFIFKNKEQQTRARKMGIKNPSHVYSLQELAQGPVVFCATGVTNGRLLKGVQLKNKQIETTTLYMDEKTRLTIHSQTPAQETL